MCSRASNTLRRNQEQNRVYVLQFPTSSEFVQIHVTEAYFESHNISDLAQHEGNK